MLLERAARRKRKRADVHRPSSSQGCFGKAHARSAVNTRRFELTKSCTILNLRLTRRWPTWRSIMRASEVECSLCISRAMPRFLGLVDTEWLGSEAGRHTDNKVSHICDQHRLLAACFTGSCCAWQARKRCNGAGMATPVAPPVTRVTTRNAIPAL